MHLEAARAGVRLQIHVGKTPELIAACHGAVACSGSVSLELLHHLKPALITYRTNRFGMAAQALLRTAPYITLVNLLEVQDASGRLPAKRRLGPGPAALYPEYLTAGDASADLAGRVLEWLESGPTHAATVARLEALRDRFGQPGATTRAADAIARLVQSRSADRPATSSGAPLRRPHFLDATRTPTER
jgi:lipid-A-disaccharide synthase